MMTAVGSGVAWSGFSIPITLILLVISLIYLGSWFRLRKYSSREISARRCGAFIGGMCLVWIAVASPLAMLDHQFLTMHMAQHLLLMTIAAPLILVGEPVLCLDSGLPRFLRERWIGVQCRTPILRLGRLVANPAFCLLSATAVLIVWHVPVIFDLAMRSEVWHTVEWASFLGGGILFWLPVKRTWSTERPSPQWGIPLYLFLATLPCDALSAFLAFCDRVVYPGYLRSQDSSYSAVLQDQGFAGALMWVVVTFAYLIPAVAVTVRLISRADSCHVPTAGANELPLRWQAYGRTSNQSAD